MSKRFRIRSFVSCLSVAVVLLISLTWMLADGRRVIGQIGNQNVPVLELNQTVNGELSAGTTQGHLVKIEAGTYVLFEAIFKQDAAQMALYGSNGELFYRQFRDARRVPTGLWQRLGRVIENAGTYRLELSAKAEQKTPSSYSLKIAELRPATEDDRAFEMAERWQQEAGKLWGEKKNFDQAIALGEKALAIFQKLSPQTGDPGNMAILLGNLYHDRGYHRDAPRRVELIEIAIRNREKILGPYDYQVALLYEELAELVDPVRAEKYLQKEMDILVRNLGNEHSFIANVLNVRANNADALGDRARATEMYLLSIQMCEKLGGTESKEMIAPLINVAQIRLEEKKLDEAEALLLKALKLTNSSGFHFEPVLFYTLAELYQLKGDFAQSDIYHQKLLEDHKASRRLPQDKAWATAYQQMGNHAIARNRYEDAAKHFGQAQKVLEMTGDSPELANLLHDWRKLHLLTGRTNDAIAAQRRAVEISEIELKRSLAYGSETDKMKVLSLAAKEMAATLSLHIQSAPESNEAKRLAFTTLLQRKGRVMDEMNRTLALLRLSAKGQDAELIEQWINKASQISLLASRIAENEDPASQLAEIEKLNREFEQLQTTISARSAEFRAQVLPPVTLGDVRKALPPGSALIEFAQYEPEDARTGKKSPARYLAYVLPKEGEIHGIELGEVAKIDAAAQSLRQAIGDKDLRADPRPFARKLDELVMRPIRPLLNQAKTVFLSPDGKLNLIPFAALRDERGRYLIEDYLFVYLTSGRDLLRLQIKHENQAEPWIFAVSDFDAQAIASTEIKPASTVGEWRGGRLSEDATMATMRFKQLAYARAEGLAVQKLFPQSRLFADGQALETALKQVRRPYFLHLATHGFFLPDSEQKLENPLLRSGLAFAGANQRQSGNDDGFLTAYEAAALDLWGTKLVVLSACDTGNGEVKTGEGVFGLRRALVLAGAETQVSSLWKADDAATQKLMQGFYSNLKAKMGRAEALRRAQLKMLKDGVYPNPYYWANFVCIGEWKPLEQ